MVATVRNLTSASATSEYFQQDGGYYLAAGGDNADIRAKQAEHRNGSAWYGRGIPALGLRVGQKVSAKPFETLLQGHVIGTGTRLGRRRDGMYEHRPGFDITFSAPKSVSLAALLPTEKHPRGDRGVLRAHDEAVRATLDWIEETMLETRGWDPATRKRPRIRAHGMAAATFRHIASRNLDPQLHTHAVIANMTRDGEGHWKSIEPTLLHRNARLIGAYYRNELSRRLVEKGYSIEPAMAGRLPSFEIAGYDRGLLAAFSTRRRDILAYMEEKGWDHGAAAAQVAALATRRKKAEPLRSMLHTVWSERARETGHESIPPVARSRGRGTLPAGPSALEIAWRTMRHLEERQSVFAERDLEALALGHSPGRYSIGEIRDAIAWLLRDGHLREAEIRGSDRAFVTDLALKAERSVIAMMKAGLGAGSKLALEKDVSAHLADTNLTEGQLEAVGTILLSDDRTVGVQGRAGTGKTTMLRQVRELAEDRFVLGLAPSAKAADVLRNETGMHARTLQWFLTRYQSVEGTGFVPEDQKELFSGSVLVLDEASMVSTDQMRSLMRIADALDIARLVLVGDSRQLRAVDAGQPFRQLQQAGMTTALMDDIRRQRDPDLRAAVLAVIAGEPGEAVELLGSSVHEVAFDELAEKAAETWLALAPEVREQTLLVAPTHELRARINHTVREALAEEGVLRGRPFVIDRLVSLGMTRSEKADLRNYREGDMIVFHQDLLHYRVKKDEILTVTGIEDGHVELLHPDGKTRRIRPEGKIRYRFDVYETRDLELRTGDRIRWTRNDKARGLVNGEHATVEAITRERVRFRLSNGHGFSLRKDDPQLRHLDHAWSSTVHGAQGSTADGVIAVLDSSHGALTDQSTFYVEISRARDRAVVLTDNRDDLVEMLEANTGERATALEAVGERIGPDLEELLRLVPQKEPVLAPDEERMLTEEPGLDEAHESRDAEIFALRDQTARLLVEHRQLVEKAGSEPPTELDGYRGWSKRCENARTRRQAMLDDPGTWQPHLERLHEEALELAEAVRRLADLSGQDRAWAELAATRRNVLEQAKENNCMPFHLRGWQAFVNGARTVAEWLGMADAAVKLAVRVLDYDRECRAARATVESFFEDAREHGKRWNALREEARQRTRQGHATSLADLDDYRSLADFARRLQETGKTLGEDDKRYKGHLERIRNGPARLQSELDRLKRHGPFDRFASAMERLEDARKRARTLGTLAFHDNGYPGAIDELEQLKQEPGLDAPARARLVDVLSEHAVRDAEWSQVQQLLNTLDRLKDRILDLEEHAGREKAPLTLLRGWPGCRDESLNFEMDAQRALDDEDLAAHWRSRPEDHERIREGLLQARAWRHLPEVEEERIAVMVHDELERLRDPRIRYEYSHEFWKPPQMLVAGDRLRLRPDPEEPAREAIVRGAGWSGGQNRNDMLKLEWLEAGPERANIHRSEWISVRHLEGCSVHRARWSDERLRERELARQKSGSSEEFPMECARDIVVGDLLHWAEVIEPQSDASPEGRPSLARRAKAVQFEGMLVERTVEKIHWNDRCTVEVRRRSDGGPCETRTMSFAELTGRGCWRSLWDDETERLARRRVHGKELSEERRRLYRIEPHHEQRLRP